MLHRFAASYITSHVPTHTDTDTQTHSNTETRTQRHTQGETHTPHTHKHIVIGDAFCVAVFPSFAVSSVLPFCIERMSAEWQSVLRRPRNKSVRGKSEWICGTCFSQELQFRAMETRGTQRGAGSAPRRTQATCRSASATTPRPAAPRKAASNAPFPSSAPAQQQPVFGAPACSLAGLFYPTPWARRPLPSKRLSQALPTHRRLQHS